MQCVRSKCLFDVNTSVLKILINDQTWCRCGEAWCNSPLYNPDMERKKNFTIELRQKLQDQLSV